MGGDFLPLVFDPVRGEALSGRGNRVEERAPVGEVSIGGIGGNPCPTGHLSEYHSVGSSGTRKLDSGIDEGSLQIAMAVGRTRRGFWHGVDPRVDVWPAISQALQNGVHSVNMAEAALEQPQEVDFPMLSRSYTFSSFSSDRIADSIRFYRDVLGLDLEESMGGFALNLAGDRRVFVYPKSEHVPADFTVLNFLVDDIDRTVDDLNDRGVVTKIYTDDEFPTDAKGIARSAGEGPDIAWFLDPAGNVLSVLCEPRDG